MSIKNKNKYGFTLIEMLVAMAIFLVVISIYMNIFVGITKTHAKLIAIQKVQNEIRYVTETLTSSIRMGDINFDYYDDNTNPKTILALKDSSQDDIFYRIYNGVFQTSRDALSWTDLSYSNVYFDRMSFYLTGENNHSGVMFFIDAHYKKSQTNMEKEARFALQSFASSRQYKR